MGYSRCLAVALCTAWTMAPALAQAAAQTGAQAAPAPYGPVLYLKGKPVPGAPHRDPAAVRDEADTGANPAAAPVPPRSGQQDQQDQQAGQPQRKRQAARRHPAWQAQNEPMAPRPLRADQAGAARDLTIPPPLAAPQPAVPSSSMIRGCQGSFCTDASGKSYNGSGNAGVDSSGRLCSRTGATLQCF
jgi:hypothetical protein